MHVFWYVIYLVHLKLDTSFIDFNGFKKVTDLAHKWVIKLQVRHIRGYEFPYPSPLQPKIGKKLATTLFKNMKWNTSQDECACIFGVFYLLTFIYLLKHCQLNQ